MPHLTVEICSPGGRWQPHGPLLTPGVAPGFAGRSDRRAGAAAAVVAGETLLFAGNRCRCPLTRTRRAVRRRARAGDRHLPAEVVRAQHARHPRPAAGAHGLAARQKPHPPQSAPHKPRPRHFSAPLPTGHEHVQAALADGPLTGGEAAVMVHPGGDPGSVSLLADRDCQRRRSPAGEADVFGAPAGLEQGTSRLGSPTSAAISCTRC